MQKSFFSLEEIELLKKCASAEEIGEFVEKRLPWLSSFLGSKRDDFYRGIARFIEDHKITLSEIVETLAKNKSAMIATLDAIIKTSEKEEKILGAKTSWGKGKTEKKARGIAPIKNSADWDLVTEVIAASVVAGYAYKINPKFSIVIVGVETQFRNVNGAYGSGPVQVTKNSAVNELKNDYWFNGTNKTLKESNGAEMRAYTLTMEDVKNNIFLNIVAGVQTMLLKAAARNLKLNDLHKNQKLYKTIAQDYNADPNLKHDYAKIVYQNYTNFFGRPGVEFQYILPAKPVKISKKVAIEP